MKKPFSYKRNNKKQLEVNFNNNKLTSLPESLGDISSLEGLSINNNQINLLPNNISVYCVQNLAIT